MEIEHMPTPEDYVESLVAQGKAEELMNAYSEHMQSCHYVWSLLVSVANDKSDGIHPNVKTFAANLLDDWMK